MAEASGLTRPGNRLTTCPTEAAAFWISGEVTWQDCPVDALDRYLAASSANDIDALMGTLAPDAEVFSPISGRMVFRGHDDLRELADDGRIKTIRPHLRPWLALTLFALVLGPKVARHPGIVLRALRRG